MMINDSVLYHTKEEAMVAVTKNGLELENCSPKLQHNKEVVLAAIKKHSWSFEYASNELKSNRAFIMKALNEGAEPWGIIKWIPKTMHADIEVMTLVLEKSTDGLEFQYAQGKVALSKELAAKSLVKWGNTHGTTDLLLWGSLKPTMRKFFNKECWYEKAKSYLIQLEQAQMVSGGCTEEDGLVW